MLFAFQTVQKIGEAGVKIDPNEDRHSEECNYQRLTQNLLALETEQENECHQQRDEGQGLQETKNAPERRVSTSI
jgi:hypothetical protein